MAGKPDLVSSKTQKWHSVFGGKNILSSDPDCFIVYNDTFG